MDRLTLEQVAAEVEGTLVQGDRHAVVEAVSTDTRALTPGSLFVPLIGDTFDGHTFIADALASGAAATLANADATISAHVPSTAAIIRVDDTLTALQRLAAGQRSRLSGRIAAVTGSTGKTTTKDMLAAIAGTRGSVVATKGNFNNEIGLPLTLLDADQFTEVLVVEMGMRGRDEIRALARIARPDVGVITNVSPVHVELLGTVDNIAAAKRELIEELPGDGVAVLNGDDAHVRAMAANAPGSVVLFGKGEHNDVRATNVQGFGEHGFRFVLHYQGCAAPVNVPVLGTHNVMNALAAAAAAFALGFDIDNVVSGLAAVAAWRSAMRTELHTTPDGVRIINDAYNAGPVSMAAALELLSEMTGERRIAVVGDMLELGELSQDAHTEVGRDVARRDIDILVAVGKYAPTVVRAAVDAGMPGTHATACRDAGEAAALVGQMIKPGDVVLVKASRGVRLERVAEHLTRRSDEFIQGREEPAP